MGNSPSSNNISDLDPTPYLQPGITEKEVIELHNIFERLEPKDGFVKVSKIKDQYKYSIEKNNLDSMFGIREYVDFDEFFKVMASEIIYTRSKYRDVEFENHETDNGCILCGTSVERRSKIGRY
jgi:Ca2+-binding EF-hand superfamily protein